MIFHTIFCVIAIATSIWGFPATSTLVTLAPSENEEKLQNDGPTPQLDNSVKVPEPELYSMKVHTQINTRYATTTISSRVANPANKSQEVTFSIVIPETAFISKFLMELDGKVYEAYVKKKEEAKQIYDNAVASGISAGHVAVSARDSNKFTVSVNVEPLSKALFNLTYEELLTRRLGVYNLVLNLHPRRVVREMTVDVDIIEAQKITVLRTPTLRTGNEIDPDESTENNPFAVKEFTNDDHTMAHVKFAPTPAQQKELMKQLQNKNSDENSKNDDEEGISGQFVVQYDVERDPQNGQIVVYDGYFVHFFAPSDLTPLNKHVIFVLDVSGSMSGFKITQLKEAMNYILDDLRPGDYFNLIDFSYEAQVYDLDNIKKREHAYYWGRNLEPKNIKLVSAYPANKENIIKAKKVISQLDAIGGTNIYEALEVALKVADAGVNQTQSTTEVSSETNVPDPLIIFLTDGDPTVGETSTTKILQMVTKVNKKGPKYAPIFALAFGNDADRGFLKQLAIRNSGFMRHIYEASDAAVQLQQFYKQISSPLLKNITFVYPSDQIEDVTDHDFHILFSGSELVAAGKLTSKDISPEVKMRLNSHGKPQDFIVKILKPPVTVQSKPSLERLWAYLKIKQLLDKKDAYIDTEEGPVLEESTDSPIAKLDPKTIEEKAVELALNYSFVTKLTSLVVVKPNATSDVNAESLPVPIEQQLALSAAPLALNYQSMSIASFGLPGPPGYGAFLSAPATTTFPRPLSTLHFAPAPAFHTKSAFISSSFMPRLASSRISYPDRHYLSRLGGGSSYTSLVLTTSAPNALADIYEASGSESESHKQSKIDITTGIPLLERFGLKHLPWLSIYEGYVELNGTKYLEPPEGVESFGECSNAKNGTQGICTLVSKCEDSTLLTSEQVYANYICDGKYQDKDYFTMCCSSKTTKS